MSFLENIANSPVVIVTGTGGVGKTTMSCAIAISLAQQNDARVLVITIDPARRLASVLSESELGHTPKLIEHSRFIREQTTRGEVYAAMVDTVSGWQEIVERYAHSENDAQRIFENKLYKNLTTRFSHSHDFVAMDQLYEHYRTGAYDFIVLDTPPASQAFGFFDAPQAMSDFFGGKLVRLITSPYRLGRGRAAKIFDLASQPFFALGDKVLGKQFLNDVGEFFFLFHTMYDDFVERAQSITTFLASKNVHACLIVDPKQYLSRGYADMVQGLNDRNITVKSGLINNVPFSYSDVLDIENSQDNRSQGSPLDPLGELISRDIQCAHDVYKALQEPSNAPGGDFGAVSVKFSPVTRAYASDESDRLAELIQGVQLTSSWDDTI